MPFRWWSRGVPMDQTSGKRFSEGILLMSLIKHIKRTTILQKWRTNKKLDVIEQKYLGNILKTHFPKKFFHENWQIY